MHTHDAGKRYGWERARQRHEKISRQNWHFVEEKTYLYTSPYKGYQILFREPGGKKQNTAESVMMV